MSVYMTEAEQLAIFKRWWQRYQNVILIFISVLLLSYSGFKYWNIHQSKVKEQASIAYEKMMIAVSKNEQRSIHAYANQLITEHPKTVYADVAQLTLAKWYVQQSQYTLARNMLSKLLKTTNIKALSDIAHIRLARIYLFEKSYNKVLTELDEISDSLYSPLINQIRGDAYSAMGNNKQAGIYYHKSLDEFKSNGITNVFLEMIINDYE